jgi:hypothetical protein
METPPPERRASKVTFISRDRKGSEKLRVLLSLLQPFSPALSKFLIRGYVVPGRDGRKIYMK